MEQYKIKFPSTGFIVSFFLCHVLLSVISCTVENYFPVMHAQHIVLVCELQSFVTVCNYIPTNHIQAHNRVPATIPMIHGNFGKSNCIESLIQSSHFHKL